MNDDARFERLFADGLHELAPRRAPDRLRTKVKVETGEVRSRPRWLALIKEPPMRTNSRLAVGSPISRAAAVLAATLLAVVMLVSAGIAGAQILAADGPIVVDGSGGGHYTTITEAVAAAKDGDEILVRPGTYTEAVVIDKGITVRGDGPIEEIIVSAPEDGPEVDISPDWFGATEPYSFQLLETDATLSDMTIAGVRSTVIATGGSPTISGLVLEQVGLPYEGGGSAAGNGIMVHGGSTATVSGNALNGGGPIGTFDLSEPLIEGNSLLDGPHMWGGFGDGAVIRGNTISGARIRGFGLFDDTSPRLEGNSIIDAGQDAIDLQGAGAPVVSGNTISGSGGVGILAGGGAPILTGNTVSDSGIGISWSGPLTGQIGGNSVSGGWSGISVRSGSPEVTGNTVENAQGPGMQIGGLNQVPTPTLAGNVLCGNGENLRVLEGAMPVIADDNEICEDAPAE